MGIKFWGFLTLFNVAIAAGPMTHLFLGEKYSSFHFENEEETGEFLLGTLLPDIRYIAHFPRETTHSYVPCLKEVAKNLSPFDAGVKFHSWVDIVREEFVEKSGIYKFVSPYAQGYEATLLKFIEEEILAEIYDGRKWNELFDGIYREELEVASEEQIHQWHLMIQYSMAYRPSWLIWGVSYLKSEAFGISNETLYEWSYLLPQFAKDPRFLTHVSDLLSFIEEKMEESLSK